MTQSLTLKSIAPFLFTSLVLTCSAQAEEAFYMNHVGTLEFDTQGNCSPLPEINYCRCNVSPDHVTTFLAEATQMLTDCECAISSATNQDQRSYFNFLIEWDGTKCTNISKGVMLGELNNLYQTYSIWAEREFGKNSQEYSRFMAGLNVAIESRRSLANELMEDVTNGITPKEFHEIYAKAYPNTNVN